MIKITVFIPRKRNLRKSDDEEQKQSRSRITDEIVKKKEGNHVYQGTHQLDPWVKAVNDGVRPVILSQGDIF